MKLRPFGTSRTNHDEKTAAEPRLQVLLGVGVVVAVTVASGIGDLRLYLNRRDEEPLCGFAI